MSQEPELGRPHAPAETTALVVGGGIAGIAAATSLMERGVKVTLVEALPTLGGRAGGFELQLQTGERCEMERGFHAFFRQYYNLRALLGRVDPALSMLTPLADYPILGPAGQMQSFQGLPTRTPQQILALVARTPYLRWYDLLRVNGAAALQMLAYDPVATYERFDHISAAEYLDSLRFTTTARRMLFDVFAHSFFNPEQDMSAAELLMMFHFYFTGNPEGLVFDVARKPLSQALWSPFGAWLRERGVSLQLGQPVTQVERTPGGGYRVIAAGRALEADLLVLALDPPHLRSLVQGSSDLAPLAPSLAGVQVTNPFAVWRLWLDRPVMPSRAPFVGTTGLGLLDNISIYNHFQDESQAWAERHGGSVVELHAYAVPPTTHPGSIRAELLAGLHRLYPETRLARPLDDCFLLRQDCPSFAVGEHRKRPAVATALPGLALAGDGIATDVPCALMERAAVTGIQAANTLLTPLQVASAPLRSVPSHGILTLPTRARRFADVVRVA